MNAFQKNVIDRDGLHKRQHYLAIADQLAQLACDLRATTTPPCAPLDVGIDKDDSHRSRLVFLAEQELKRREQRSQHLPDDFFGDAAWAMMLDLFVSECRRKKLSTTSLCAGSAVPMTTALRWLDALVHEGLADREADRTDKRVKNVRLTQKGRDAVRHLLGARLP